MKLFKVLLIVSFILTACAAHTQEPSVISSPTLTKSPTPKPTRTPTKNSVDSETPILESTELKTIKAEFLELYSEENLSTGKIHMILDLSTGIFKTVTIKAPDGTDLVSAAQMDGYIYIDGKWINGKILDPVCREIEGFNDFFCLSLSNASIQITTFPLTPGWAKAAVESFQKFYNKNLIIVEIDFNSKNSGVQRVFKGVFPEFDPQKFKLVKTGGYDNVIPAEGIAYPAK